MDKKVYINNFIFKRDGFNYYFMYNKYQNKKINLYKYIINFIENSNENREIVFNNIKTKVRNGKLFIINFDVNNSVESLNRTFEFIGIECKDNFGNKFIEKDIKIIKEILDNQNEEKVKSRCDIDICNEDNIDLKKLLLYFKKCKNIDCNIFGYCNDIFVNYNGLFKSNIFKYCLKKKKIETIDDLLEFDIFLQNDFSYKDRKLRNSFKNIKLLDNIIQDFYKEIEKLNVDLSIENSNFIFSNLLTEEDIEYDKTYYISFFNFSYTYKNGVYSLNKNHKYNGVRPIKINKHKNSYRIIDKDGYIILKDNIDNLIYDLTIHLDKESAQDSLNKKISHIYKHISNLERVIDERRG